MTSMRSATRFGKQSGAALFVGLILLVVITVLAMSGMGTAATELAMARSRQAQENAFQAAETGLELALTRDEFELLGVVQLADFRINSRDAVHVQIEYEGATQVPGEVRGADVGDGAVAHHFVATARALSRPVPGATTDRDATAVHTQAFFVIGPDTPADTIAADGESLVRTVWTRQGLE